MVIPTYTHINTVLPQVPSQTLPGPSQQCGVGASVQTWSRPGGDGDIGTTGPSYLPLIGAEEFDRTGNSIIQWIGLRENLNRKPWFLPSNRSGFPLKMFPSSNSMNNSLEPKGPMAHDLFCIFQELLGLLLLKHVFFPRNQVLPSFSIHLDVVEKVNG